MATGTALGTARRRFKAPLGASLVVLSSVFYASYGVWTLLIGDFFEAFTQATIRCALTTLLLVAGVLLFKQFTRVEWRRDLRWFGLSFVASIFIPATLYYAVLNAGMGVSLGVAYIGIVLGMFFFGWLFAGEQFTRDKWLSTLLSVIGLGLVFSPSIGMGGADLLAVLAALVSGIATALNIVIAKKLPYSALQTAATIWAVGTLANLPFIFIFGEAMPASGWHIEWLWICLFAFASVAASWTIVQGVRLIEAGAAGILSLLDVVFAVLFGMLFFGERPEVQVFLGMLAIIAAATIPYVKDYNSKRGTLDDPQS